MVGWHHWLNRHEFEQAPGDNEGQGSLACFSSWGLKESDMTVWLNNNNKSFEDYPQFITWIWPNKVFDFNSIRQISYHMKKHGFMLLIQKKTERERKGREEKEGRERARKGRKERRAVQLYRDNGKDPIWYQNTALNLIII